MSFRKGQAALDFLMTYGWAIALVVIIAAVLFALGIFNVSNFVGSKAAGFSGVAVSGWKYDPTGTLSMVLSNQVGDPIQVEAINASLGTGVNPITSFAPVFPSNTVATGQSINEVGTPSPLQNLTTATGYTAQVTITYEDLTTDFNYTTTGTLTGKVTQ